MISRVDHQFGQIVNKTKEQGLWNSTITFMFTDHGEFLGDWGVVEKWPSGVSDNLVHDPLMVGGANLPKGVEFNPMVEMIDLVPSMLQLGQVNETYQHYGKSFVDANHALGRGKEISHRDYSMSEGGFLLTDEPLLEQEPFPYDIKVALQHNDTALVGSALAVRDQKWTYIYRLYEDDELYSRDNDAEEMHNLAASPDYAGIRMKIRDVALHFLMSTPGSLPWYKDDRKPAVALESPFQQFVERGGRWI